jgi:hypothetical protein
MQCEDWIILVRMFPEDQQNRLVLTTTTGVNLNIEVIMRLEPNYLVFRGRAAGQTDDGRVFFLPYRQIDFLQINREVKESEIQELYGELSDSMASHPSTDLLAEADGAGAFQAAVPSLSNQGLMASPTSPSAPAPASPTRPSIPGIVARLGTAAGAGHVNGGRLSNGPMPAPHANGTLGADAPTPPRNSILERLRAQRNSIPPTRPIGR